MADELIKYYDSSYDDIEIYLVAPIRTLSSTRQFVAVDAYEDVYTSTGTYSYYLDLSNTYSPIVNYINYFGNGIIIFDASFRYNCCFYGVSYNSSEQRLYLSTFTPQVGDYFFGLPMGSSLADHYSMLDYIGNDGISFTSYYFNEGVNRQIYRVKPLGTSSSAGYTYTALPDSNWTGAICIGNIYGNLSVNPGTGGGGVDDLDTELEINNAHIGTAVSSNYFINGYKFKANYVTTNSATYQNQGYDYDSDDKFYYRQGNPTDNILYHRTTTTNKKILKTNDLMELRNPLNATISEGATLGNYGFRTYTYDVGTATAPSTPSVSTGTNKGYIYIRQWTSSSYTNYTATFYRYHDSAGTILGSVDLRNGTTQRAAAFWIYSVKSNRYVATDCILFIGKDGYVGIISGGSTRASTFMPTSKEQTAAIPYKTS